MSGNPSQKADGATVVVIDDEPGIIDFVELGLGHEGLNVVSAGDAATGLATVRRTKPQLVILDAGLPDADGFDLLRRIRSESDVPVIMLTARGDLDDRVREVAMAGSATYASWSSCSSSCAMRSKSRLGEAESNHASARGVKRASEAGPVGIDDRGR